MDELLHARVNIHSEDVYNYAISIQLLYLFTCRTIVESGTMSLLYASRVFRSSNTAARRIIAAVRVAPSVSEVRGGFNTDMRRFRYRYWCVFVKCLISSHELAAPGR